MEAKIVFLFSNITDSSNDPKVLRINDIPNRGHHVEVHPGETVDLEILSNRNQICQSHHIKTWVNQGFATTDTLGTSPFDNCPLYVEAKITEGIIDIGDINIGEIDINIDVNGTSTPVSGIACGTKTAIVTQECLPNTPLISEIDINTANLEESFTLPINTRRYMVYVEEESIGLELGFISAGNKIIVPCSTNYTEKGVDASGLDLYFQTDMAPAKVKIISWSVS